MNSEPSDVAALPAGVSAADRDVLRELARRVRALALSDDMEARRERWRRHNALVGARPMILCFPEGAWDELLPAEVCRCAHPVLRRWEHGLRRTLFWWDHIRDDAAIDATLDVHWHLDTGSPIPWSTTPAGSPAGYAWPWRKWMPTWGAGHGAGHSRRDREKECCDANRCPCG